MSKSNKVLTSEYLDWHTKLTGLPRVLTNKIHFNLYKKYKRETGLEPWQLSEGHLLINSKQENKVSDLSFSEQCEEKGPITFEAKPDPELIIKSVLEHFTYLKFRSTRFRELIIIILHLLSRGTHHALFATENMGIMNYMANGIETERNIVLLATVQAINSSSQLY